SDRDTDTLQMTLLKRQLCASLRREDQQTLKQLLSTFYALSMVAQGHTAVLVDELRQLQGIRKSRLTHPSTANRIAQLTTTSLLALEEIQNLSEAIGETESALEDAMRSSLN